MTKIPFLVTLQVLVSVYVVCQADRGDALDATSTSRPASRTPSALTARCRIGFDLFFERSLKEDTHWGWVGHEILIFGLTESDGEVEYGADKVPEAERAVLPDVLGHDGPHDRGVELEADVQQSLPQPLGLQDARLLLGVRLEGALPELDGADEVLELLEVDLAEALRVEGGYDEAAHLQTGAALDVI